MNPYTSDAEPKKGARRNIFKPKTPLQHMALQFSGVAACVGIILGWNQLLIHKEKKHLHDDPSLSDEAISEVLVQIAGKSSEFSNLSVDDVRAAVPLGGDIRKVRKWLDALYIFHAQTDSSGNQKIFIERIPVNEEEWESTWSQSH